MFWIWEFGHRQLYGRPTGCSANEDCCEPLPRVTFIVVIRATRVSKVVDDCQLSKSILVRPCLLRTNYPHAKSPQRTNRRTYPSVTKYEPMVGQIGVRPSRVREERSIHETKVSPSNTRQSCPEMASRHVVRLLQARTMPAYTMIC